MLISNEKLKELTDLCKFLCGELMLKINLAFLNVWFTEQFCQCFIDLCHRLVFKGQ